MGVTIPRNIIPKVRFCGLSGYFFEKRGLTISHTNAIIAIESEREVNKMRIEKSDDRAYPYTIKGGWGDKVYCTVANLKEIKKQINVILKEEKNEKSVDK